MSRTAVLTEAEFIEEFSRLGAAELARKYDLPETSVASRRRRLEHKLGIEIVGPRGRGATATPVPQFQPQIMLGVQDAVVVVASDCHYWPGEITLMHRALVWACRELRPDIIVLNGDVCDFPSLSRHPRIRWEERPTMISEIEWAQERLTELVKAIKKPGVRKIWTEGNHDARFESRLANLAPEYAKAYGVHLSDHFPLWEHCVNVVINRGTPDDTQINHSFKGGIHAVHNNLLWSGGHTVTGHLHSAQVRALTLRHGRTIWGVDTGCVADPYARSFNYIRGNPRNWRAGFAVLTYKEGRLMMPDLFQIWDDDHVQFRGEVFKP